MFGHDWEHGTAKVIDRELVSSGGGETPGQHRYVVEVENPTGEPFRGAIEDPRFRSRSYVVAHVGEEVAVLVDFKRQKVNGTGVPRITINGKAFEGPMDKAELQRRLAEAGKSPDQE